MAQKSTSRRNEYRCSVEINQNGKYCVRIQVRFALRDWTLKLYYLTSSFDRAIKKLETCLQFLQRHEERLWFWGVDRSDDPNFAGELLAEAGLKLDRRGEFPRRGATLSVPPEKPVPAFAIAPMRRGLAETIAQRRQALASD